MLALTGCYPQTGTGPEASLPRVGVEKLRSEPVPDTLTLIGSIEPCQEATLYFEVSGIVEKVLVKEGDPVEPEDEIARLVLDDYRLGLSRADAELQAAQARLDSIIAMLPSSKD